MQAGYYEEKEESLIPFRWHASVIANIYKEKGKPVIKPSDLLPLSFDKKEDKPKSIKGRKGTKENPFTKEELEALRLKHFKNLN